MKSFPWDSIITGYDEDRRPIYDRSYKAEDLAEVYRTFFSDGVFIDSPDSFRVEPAAEGMAVQVSAGKCCISGHVGWEGGNGQMLAIEAASTSVDRIDTVVLRFDANTEAREIGIYVLTGTAAASPVRPTLTRNETVYELGICDILVPKNSTSISAANITDTRLDDERCGVARALVDVDTTTFYSQLQAAISLNIAELSAQTQKAIDLANSALDGSLPAEIAANAERSALEKAFPVGSIFISTTAARTPGAVLGFGEWTAINNGAVLQNTTSLTKRYLGTAANSVSLAASNIPSHTHTMVHTHTIAHTHTFSHYHTTYAHNHTTGDSTRTLFGIMNGSNLSRSSVPTVGSSSVKGYVLMTQEGAQLYWTASTGDSSATTNAQSTTTTSGASAANSGASSAASTGATGSGSSFSVQPYAYTVVMWERTA